MFAILFLVLFWLIHRLCERLALTEHRCRTLVQEDLALSNKRSEDLIEKSEKC